MAAATKTVEGAAATPLPLSPCVALYVGDLDPAVSKDDLLRAFGCYGPVSSVHLCENRASGESLRYGYVNFISSADAREAHKALNHTHLKGKPMRIMWSNRDPLRRKTGIGNLFVKNLDVSVDSAQLEDLFAAHGAVASCKVAADGSGRSKGFGFVQMDSEEAAQQAIAALHGVRLHGGSKPLYVSKFVKKSERQAQAEESRFANLYIKNLDGDLTDDLLRQEFSTFGEIDSAVVMKDEQGRSRCFGFVSFLSPQHANKAMEVMNGARLGTKRIYVARAQAKAERMELLKQQFADQWDEPPHPMIKGSAVYFRNLDCSVDSKGLREYFGESGKIVSTKVIHDTNGVRRGFGYVCFSSPAEAQKAVAILNGKVFHGKRLHVAIARDQAPVVQPLASNSYLRSYDRSPHCKHQQCGMMGHSLGYNGDQFASDQILHYPQLPYANASWANSAPFLGQLQPHPVHAVYPTLGRFNIPAVVYGKNGGLNFGYYQVPKPHSCATEVNNKDFF